MERNESELYPGFPYPAGKVAKFAQASSLSTLLLKDCNNAKGIVHFEPENADDFRRWLTAHNVTDVKVQINDIY